MVGDDARRYADRLSRSNLEKPDDGENAQGMQPDANEKIFVDLQMRFVGN